MTADQVKYQQIMEEKRHNLVMEKYGAVEARSNLFKAEASLQQSRTSAIQAENALEQTRIKSAEQKWNFLGQAVNTAAALGQIALFL